MKHPVEAELALYAGGDAALWSRVRLAFHLWRCRQCRATTEQFRAVGGFLTAQRGELPSGLDWRETAAAMRANIRLGLAAGQCVASEEPERLRVPWRTPALALPVLLIIVVGWILQSMPPRPDQFPQLERLQSPGTTVLDAGSSGIGVERAGRGFRLLPPQAAENVEVFVRGDSVRSRYVDGETGQVTITHVYAE